MAFFAAFLACSDWMSARFGRAHSLNLEELALALYAFLTGPGGCPPAEAAAALACDYSRGEARRLPRWLKSAAGPSRGA